MKSRNIKIIGILAGMILKMECYAQTNIYYPWNIDDRDTLFIERGISWKIRYEVTGSIFKAIDKRYIANIHGPQRSESVYLQDNLLKKDIKRIFLLNALDDCGLPDYETRHFVTSLNAQKKWNYYINDLLMYDYLRILVSTLMPQAIEKIEFMPSDTLIGIAAFLDLPPDAPLSEYKSYGAVRFYTRDISKSIIDDRTTLYLLNDDQVITRKMYEAINPVYIRSLMRITGKAELAKYGHKGIQEIVRIDLFKKTEVIEGLIIIQECPECEIYLVDNVQVDREIYYILNSLYFKEVRTIEENDEESFAPYRERFPKGQFRWKKRIIIISL